MTEVCFSERYWLATSSVAKLRLHELLGELKEYAPMLAPIGFVALVLAVATMNYLKQSPILEPNPPIEKPVQKPIPDVIKQDCQRLVEGQLVFAPSATMRQGKPSVVSARLSRGSDTKILSGLEGNSFVIENTQVSCLVTLKLDSQEDHAFKIDNVPAGRKDEQILLPNKFTQWDWRVTPLKSGVLHLLLYVTPILYVDGVGQGLKAFPQQPRVITVSPDRVYAVWTILVAHWAIWSVLLTAIILPSLYFVARRIKKWYDDRAKGPIGFAPKPKP